MTGAFSADIHRCAEKYRPRRRLAYLLADNYGLQALLAYRLGRQLLHARRSVWAWPLLPAGWMLYYLLSRYVRLAFDIRLELSADIGPGFFIGHFGAIRVRDCRIGAHCSIGRLTDIGPQGDGPGPVIGDGVWIGAHVRIVGSYRIGSGSTIGAGTVVDSDIPEAALYLGTPPRVVICTYDNRRIL